MTRASVSALWRFVRASGLYIPLLYLAGVALTVPIADPREFDFDEGVNLIKALLVGRGFTLYSEIWSDQPPLLTALLSGWLAWFGQSVVAARVLVLLFSALLLWSLYQTVRRAVSEPAAALAVIGLVLSEQYIHLSVSVMIGLPALALALLSTYLFMVAHDTRRPWLMVASGIAMAASLQIKLFTVVVALLLAGYMAIEIVLRLNRRQNSRSIVSLAVSWAAGILVAYLVLGLSLAPLSLDQLLGTHISGQGSSTFATPDSVRFVEEALLRHAVLVLLGLIGGIWAVRRRRWQALLPAAWSLVSVVALLYQKPLQYHYVLLLTIPLAWLSAFGFDAGLAAFTALGRTARAGVARPALIGGASLTLLLMGWMVYTPDPPRLRIAEEMAGVEYNEWALSRLCPDGRHGDELIWTDRPYYAFLAGRSEPPWIAVATLKRHSAGSLDESTLLQTLETSRPRYVILERFVSILSPEFYAELEKLYRPVATWRWGIQQSPGQFYVVRADATGALPERALFGGWLGLEWTAGSIPAASSAGNCLGLDDLVWSRPEGAAGQDLALSLRLADGDGQVWYQHDEALGSDWNTIRDRTSLAYVLNPLLPEGTPPGDYSLLLTVYDPNTGQPLPAVHGDGPPVDQLVLGRVRVDPPAEAPVLRAAAGDFGPLRFVELSTPASEISPGDSIPVSMLWQAAGNYRPDKYVLVVQLLDAKGAVLAGLEEEPLQGRYPTERWRAGELVRDRHVLGVPAGVPPGSHTLIAGIYRASDRVRLHSSSGFLGLASGDHSVIRNITVH